MNPDDLSKLLRARRSVRDFLPDPVPQDVLERHYDALQSPSWSTPTLSHCRGHGRVRDRITEALTANFDAGMRAMEGGALGKLKAFVTREGMPTAISR